MRKILRLKNLTMIATSCLAMLLLQGCGNKVDCNGGKVKSDAIDIIQSHLNDTVWYRQISLALTGEPQLSGIKTVARNDETKQAECSATYSFTYNGKPRTVDVSYYLAYLEDQKNTEVKVAVDPLKAGFIGMIQSEPPIRNGVEKVMDEKTGNLDYTITWENGVQNGVQKFYNPANGKLIGEVGVVNNKKSGSEKRWSADGSELVIDLNWVDGKATGFEKQYSDNGKLITDLTWKDGKQSGLQRIGAGEVYDEYHLKDGVYDGIHNHYSAIPESARYQPYLSMTENFKNGKLDGLHREFSTDGSGKVTYEKLYRDGVEVPGNPLGIPGGAAPGAPAGSAQ